jgi:hypothetical protein
MVENDILSKGYYIQKMEGCPPWNLFILLWYKVWIAMSIINKK